MSSYISSLVGALALDEMRIKQSKVVVLVMLCSLATVACAYKREYDPGEQRLYRSKADCLADWKYDKYCEQDVGSAGRYYGPLYWYNAGRLYATTRSGQLDMVRTDVPTARSFTTTGSFGRSSSIGVARGGFGGSAMGHFGGS